MVVYSLLNDHQRKHVFTAECVLKTFMTSRQFAVRLFTFAIHQQPFEQSPTQVFNPHGILGGSFIHG